MNSEIQLHRLEAAKLADAIAITNLLLCFNNEYVIIILHTRGILRNV